MERAAVLLRHSRKIGGRVFGLVIVIDMERKQDRFLRLYDFETLPLKTLGNDGLAAGKRQQSVRLMLPGLVPRLETSTLIPYGVIP
jgi:hypothetical protein